MEQFAAVDMKVRIQNYWDRSANGYDNQFGHGIHSAGEKELWLDLLARYLPAGAGAKILDVGCGTGFLSLLAAEIGLDVTGIDFSEAMRSEGRRKAEAAGLKVNLLKGDAEAPDFPPGTFEAVISRHVMWTLPYPGRALRAWKDLLAPGGRVVVIDGVWTPRDFPGLVRSFVAHLIRRLKNFKRHSAWKKEYMRKKGDLPFFGGAEPETIEAFLEAAGFTDIRRNDMAAILDHERRFGTMEYRIAHAKNRRYLISGRKTA
ncbi:class I SAM-dependent methyltransferase [Desulfosarcina ovata]|uniref:SAM-dependent methyltransferase n=1 Tax=Desulfosarcina ovata subsp. ovata TaxID=2752305 RepID=A0A5K8AAT9_9BACT|nr:class I SAM-dependent methyltransferase [Desulfosarcina ovata]BBO89598.1 SAM-dependent methyltransferase [Desulfosarcina ovata subsp. ovata]